MPGSQVRLPPPVSHVVILENLSSHEQIEARDAIEAVGARLWLLPRCSPDLSEALYNEAALNQLFRFALLAQSSVLRIGEGTLRFDRCENFSLKHPRRWRR